MANFARPSVLLVLAAAAHLAACNDSAPSKEEASDAPVVETPAAADAALLTPREALDYADPAMWLCVPGRDDACAVDLSAAVIEADGRTHVEGFAANANAPIDCFYVYPTVSADATPNADAIPGEEEMRAAAIQAGRFASVCRLYAPVYRQVSVTALRAMLAGGSPGSDRELAFADVRAAWAHYMANHNEGRGVLLIGHDQGAGVLGRLIASDIVNGPARAQLVGAILPGANVRGDELPTLKPCASARDVGCVIAYAAYRAETPPGEGALFGRAAAQNSRAGGEAICVNPADLDGSGGVLKPLMPTQPANMFMQQPGPWVAGADDPVASLVSPPGLLTASCQRSATHSYLEVTTLGDPDGARIDAIAGDVMIDGAPRPDWGLHLVDINIALGNLVAVARELADAYVSQTPDVSDTPDAPP